MKDAEGNWTRLVELLKRLAPLSDPPPPLMVRSRAGSTSLFFFSFHTYKWPFTPCRSTGPYWLSKVINCVPRYWASAEMKKRSQERY